MTRINYTNMHFLVIDNIKPSNDVLKKFAMSLTTKEVDSTYYAKDAIPLCLEKKYDVIFLGYDLGEKQKNGQQLLEELRTSEVISRHCIVIMITAEVSQAMVLAALEHKPDSYLCKPYTVNELHKRLDSCARKKYEMRKIYQALENDDKELAISLSNEAIGNKTPYLSECLGIKSRQFFELKEFEQAKSIYSHYQDQENYTWASIGLGKIALQEKNFTNAEIIFKKIIEEKPLYLPSYDWLAVTYEKKFDIQCAEDTLEKALNLSPRSVKRLKKYANLCFKNEHFDKATNAYKQVYDLAYNSIHYSPENALLFAQALSSYSSELPLDEAKKKNNTAFNMFSQVNKSFSQPEIKIQSHLLSACLLENIHDYMVAKNKLELGLKLLEKEQYNIDSESLKAIASSLTKLNRNSKASQLLITANQQHVHDSPSSNKIGSIPRLKENESYAIKAQKALNLGKQLYNAKEYDESINSLSQALKLYPSHNGIKLNLLQILLGTCEANKYKIKELEQAKKIILDLINTDKTTEENTRYKKMKIKYQQLANI